MCCICEIVEHDSDWTCYDSNDGALDTAGNDCLWYIDRFDSCGAFNDDDFDAWTMCCECDGGCTDTDNGALNQVG